MPRGTSPGVGVTCRLLKIMAAGSGRSVNTAGSLKPTDGNSLSEFCVQHGKSDQSNCGVSTTSRQREQTRPSTTFPGKARLMENQHRTPGRQSIERTTALAGDRTCRGLRQRSSPRKWARPRPLPPRELLASTLAGCQNRGAIGIPHLSCAINCPEIVHGVSARTEITRLSTLNKLEISRRRTDLCSLFRQWV